MEKVKLKIELAFKPLFALMQEQERRRRNFMIASAQNHLSLEELKVFHEREEAQHIAEEALAKKYLENLKKAVK